MKIGRNDPCPCGSGKKYKKCCLDKDVEKVNLTGDDLPLYNSWITSPKGSRAVLIARAKPDNTYQYVSLLVDEWKMGLKDCFGSYNAPKDIIESLLSGADYVETDIQKCKKLVKRGIRIAEELRLKLPKEFKKYKSIIGDIGNIDVGGSLYKCFSCGKEDLGNEEVEMIKDITLKDVKRGVCGMPNETIVYFKCEKCKGTENENLDEEGELWSDGFFAETLGPTDVKEKMKTFHMKHDEDMRFNCKKCNVKISAHNKDWHNGLCDDCFNKEFSPDTEEDK